MPDFPRELKALNFSELCNPMRFEADYAKLQHIRPLLEAYYMWFQKISKPLYNKGVGGQSQRKFSRERRVD